MTEEENQNLTNGKKVLKGYNAQCEIVLKELENVLDKIIGRKESAVIEGVHISSKFIQSMMKKHLYTIPFVVYISKSEKHKERFAVRSKKMTIDPKFNKYVKNFDNIRTIQCSIIKKADKAFIPKIENINIDKSLG